jgi:hypothetical protein
MDDWLFVYRFFIAIINNKSSCGWELETIFSNPKRVQPSHAVLISYDKIHSMSPKHARCHPKQDPSQQMNLLAGG